MEIRQGKQTSLISYPKNKFETTSRMVIVGISEECSKEITLCVDSHDKPFESEYVIIYNKGERVGYISFIQPGNKLLIRNAWSPLQRREFDLGDPNIFTEAAKFIESLKHV